MVDLNGDEVYFDACVNLMDNDLREQLHADTRRQDMTEQQFLDAYCELHAEKYNARFEI